MIRILLPLFLLIAAALPARAETVCTIVADAQTGAVVVEQGDCTTRATPASTFKVALAVMGYDSSFLTSANTPVLEIAAGEPDWGGDAWRRPVDPAAWMRYSVVWYSQRIARALGVEQLAVYATAFGYGNADFGGDSGQNNALERAWISSSLQIAPREQVAFLARLVTGQLPVSATAAQGAMALLETQTAGTWQISGKTGSAFPRRADGSFDYERDWGWYVGWARRGDAVLVFARLTQDNGAVEGSSGVRAREALLADWPALAAAAGY